jgi:hypothetical protein
MKMIPGVHPESEAGQDKEGDIDEQGSSNFRQKDVSEDVDEEAVRREAIAESIAKLAELERDRPLWEEQAKKRNREGSSGGASSNEGPGATESQV